MPKKSFFIIEKIKKCRKRPSLQWVFYHRFSPCAPIFPEAPPGRRRRLRRLPEVQPWAGQAPLPPRRRRPPRPPRRAVPRRRERGRPLWEEGGQGGGEAAPAAGGHRSAELSARCRSLRRAFFKKIISVGIPTCTGMKISRAGHFRYFLAFSLIKNDFFAFFIKLITYFCTSPI